MTSSMTTPHLLNTLLFLFEWGGLFKFSPTFLMVSFTIDMSLFVLKTWLSSLVKEVFFKTNLNEQSGSS